MTLWGDEMGIFIVLFSVSCILFFVGLIKPKFVIRWGPVEKRNRKWAAIYTIAAAIISFILVGVTMTPEQWAESKRLQQQKQERILAEKKAEEEKKVTEEKAAKEAEAKKVAEEKIAKEAEEKKATEEKAAKEAEEKETDTITDKIVETQSEAVINNDEASQYIVKGIPERKTRVMRRYDSDTKEWIKVTENLKSDAVYSGDGLNYSIDSLPCDINGLKIKVIRAQLKEYYKPQGCEVNITAEVYNDSDKKITLSQSDDESRFFINGYKTVLNKNHTQVFGWPQSFNPNEAKTVEFGYFAHNHVSNLALGMDDVDLSNLTYNDNITLEMSFNCNVANNVENKKITVNLGN